MGRENGVNQCRLAQPRLTFEEELWLASARFAKAPSIPTNTDDIELEAAFEQFVLNLGRDAVETDMALGIDRIGNRGSHREDRARRCRIRLTGLWLRKMRVSQLVLNGVRNRRRAAVSASFLSCEAVELTMFDFLSLDQGENARD